MTTSEPTGARYLTVTVAALEPPGRTTTGKTTRRGVTLKGCRGGRIGNEVGTDPEVRVVVGVAFVGCVCGCDPAGTELEVGEAVPLVRGRVVVVT